MGNVIQFPGAKRKKNAASLREMHRLLCAEHIDAAAVYEQAQIWFHSLSARAQMRWLAAGADWADAGAAPTAYDAWCAYDAEECGQADQMPL